MMPTIHIALPEEISMPVSTEPRSRRSVELLVACCAVLGLLFAAGCSSDSGSSTDASDTTIGAEKPHRQEWIDRGH